MIHRSDCDLGEDCSCGRFDGRHLLYIVGQPGSGKSTLVAALLDGLLGEVTTMPFAHTVWANDAVVVCELGRRRDSFSGTDALSMSVQPKAIQFLADHPFDYVLAEGDRLATNGFLLGAREVGYAVDVVYLAVSSAVAEHRRASRAAELGSQPQDAAWIAGRVSKARKLAEAWGAHVLDADRPPAEVLAQLRATGNPLVTLLQSDA